MKNFKHLFTALLLLCATVASAHDFKVDGIYYNFLSEEDKTVEVTYRGNSIFEYSGEYSGVVTIPATFTYHGTTYSVTSIGNYAFRSCSGLTSIEIPNSVTSIGNDAFRRCSGLTSIEIPNSVTSIGNYAFENCSGLTSIEIPNSVTSIGGGVFSGCSGLTSIEIPNSVTSIGYYAFLDCSGLTSIEIPNSVTTIGEYAFTDCTSLTSIEIPNSVTSIGNYAFRSCSGLTSIKVGSENTVYDSRDNCNAIIETRTNTLIAGFKNTIIPNSVTTIGEYAFTDCTSLTSIEIPNSVTSIGNDALYNCTGLTSIEIPNSVTSIGNDAFRRCSGLTSIKVGSENTVYDSRDNCNAIIETKTNTLIAGCKNTIIPNNITSIQVVAFENCTGLTSIEIPNSVTSIGEMAFSGCTNLTTLIIGKRLVEIWCHAFYGCYNLKTIINFSKMTVGRDDDYSYLGYYADKIINAPNGSIEEDFVFGIIDDVDMLCGYIGNSTSIALPQNYKGENYGIRDYAFNDNTSLANVIIPNSVTSIGENAFSNCTGLTSITSQISADNLFAISTTAFSYVDKNACTLYVPAGAKETYAATAGWSEFVNIVELERPTIKVTINQYGNATFCSEYALDFSEVEGLKAYAATGYNSTTQVVTLTRVQTTKEETGLFLMGEPGEYKVPVIEYSSDNTLNLLVGTLEQTTVNSTDGAMSNYKFTITEGDEAPMFYPFEDNTTFSAGKAYLQIPTAWLPATAQKAALSIRFDNGTTTDIEEIENESVCGQNVYYDLQGRKVVNPTNGIYIINGKKVFIK